MTYQNTIHKPQIQYTSTAVSENRKSDGYYYGAGREEESKSVLTVAATEYRKREERQQQLEQELQISGMKLSAQILKALNSLEAHVIFQRVADSGINGIDNTSLGRGSTTTNNTQTILHAHGRFKTSRFNIED